MALTFVVDRARNELLPSAGFAMDQHGCVRRSDQADRIPDLAQATASANDGFGFRRRRREAENPIR